MVIGKIQVIPMEKQIEPSPENCKKELNGNSTVEKYHN